MDNEKRKFRIYIKQDNNRSERKLLKLVSQGNSTVLSLMTSTISRYDINMANKLHRYSQETATEMTNMLRDAGMLTPQLRAAWIKAVQVGDESTGLDRRSIKNNILLSYINAALNQEIQADFLVVRIAETNHYVLNIVDRGKRYGLRYRVDKRLSETLKELLETRWFFEFGAQKSFRADPEFTWGIINELLRAHNKELGGRWA